MKRFIGVLLVVSTSLMMIRCGDGAVEDAESWDEGLGPDRASPVNNLVTTGLNIFNNVNAVIGFVTGAAALIDMLVGGGNEQAGASVEEVAGLLRQQTLAHDKWIVLSGNGQLRSTAGNYFRRSCTYDKWPKDQNCQTAAQNQYTEALSLNQLAAGVFYQVHEADLDIGDQKLQLVPVMMEAGSIMIFALQEVGVAEREMIGYTESDLQNREGTIRDAANSVLLALDRAEVLLQQAYRNKCGPIVFRETGTPNLRTIWAEFTDDQGIRITTFQLQVQPGDQFTSGKNNVLAKADDLMNKGAMDYFRAHRYEVFGSQYYSYRQKLMALANTSSQTRYTIKFAWSSAGPHNPRGWACMHINEPGDPYTWDDNYFCASRPIGMRWTYYAGTISGMNCTKTSEAADPHGWGDNAICLPQGAPFMFSWSSGGPISGKQCTQWYEASDPNTWNDNYLCYPQGLYY